MECGACDQRFKVSPETIIENKDKFYPGEHHDALLDRLGKKPPRKVQTVNFAQAEYTPDAVAEEVLPASAGQKIAVMVGIGAFLFYSLVFVLGSAKGGLFQDIDVTKRLILAGFVSVSSSALIIFGAKGWRARSILFSTFLSSCLIVLVFLMPVEKIPSAESWSTSEGEDGDRSPSDKPTSPEETGDETGVKGRVDYAPMQREIDKYTDEEKGIDGLSMVTGIYVEGISEIELMEVEQYLQRKLSLPKSEAPAAYSRKGGKDRFIVFSGIVQRFESFVGHCEALGTVRTHPNYRVIELTLNKELFANPSREVNRQLTDPKNPSFFNANLEMLGHVSLTRLKEAVERLANIPAEVEIRKMPRMNDEFVRILREENDAELINNVGKALRIWAKGDDEVVSTVGGIVSRWSQKGRQIPTPLVEFLGENGSEEAALVIDRLWVKNPETWSELYASLGAEVAEGRLLFHLQGSPETLKKSALGILRKIGTEKSLPELEKLKAHENDEIQILAVRAISAIKAKK